MAPARYPRQLRLLKPREFQRVFDRARRFSSAGMTVLARRNGLAYARLGLVVSTRCAKRACDRNRLKRLARESFRAHQDQLRGWDVVVIGRAGVVQLSNGQVLASLAGHWIKVQRCVES